MKVRGHRIVGVGVLGTFDLQRIRGNAKRKNGVSVPPTGVEIRGIKMGRGIIGVGGLEICGLNRIGENAKNKNGDSVPSTRVGVLVAGIGQGIGGRVLTQRTRGTRNERDP